MAFEHHLVHVRVGFGELAQDLLAHLLQRVAAEVLVQIVRGALQLIRGVAPLGLDDAVLHLAVVVHQHHQHAVLAQGHELELAHLRGARARQRHDAGELRGAREQL